MICERCKSEGFMPSSTGEGCSFCDGSESGVGPGSDEYERDVARLVKAAALDDPGELHEADAIVHVRRDTPIMAIIGVGSEVSFDVLRLIEQHRDNVPIIVGTLEPTVACDPDVLPLPAIDSAHCDNGGLPTYHDHRDTGDRLEKKETGWRDWAKYK